MNSTSRCLVSFSGERHRVIKGSILIHTLAIFIYSAQLYRDLPVLLPARHTPCKLDLGVVITKEIEKT